MEELFEQAEKKGLRVVFGLEAQGHIPTIQAEIDRWNREYTEQFPGESVNMMYSTHVWERIGRNIGWDPFAAVLHYFEWLDEKHTTGTIYPPE